MPATADARHTQSGIWIVRNSIERVLPLVPQLAGSHTRGVMSKEVAVPRSRQGCNLRSSKEHFAGGINRRNVHYYCGDVLHSIWVGVANSRVPRNISENGGVSRATYYLPLQ